MRKFNGFWFFIAMNKIQKKEFIYPKPGITMTKNKNTNPLPLHVDSHYIYCLSFEKEKKIKAKTEVEELSSERNTRGIIIHIKQKVKHYKSIIRDQIITERHLFLSVSPSLLSRIL